jgi:hypothetical protein
MALVRSQRQGLGAPTDWQKIFAGADVVVTLPLANLRPYVFAGGGVVTLDEEGPTTPISSRRGGRGGLGAELWLGKVGILGQAAGWFYRWDVTSFPAFTRQQFDLLYSAGVAYRLK